MLSLTTIEVDLLKLLEAKNLFVRCLKRGQDGLIIKKHCWADYPERGFHRDEVRLLLEGKGRLTLNRFPSAKPDSFLWCCLDKTGKAVQIAVVLDEGKIVAYAISAFRKPKK